MYTTTSESHFMDLIRLYAIEYIYVGPVERLYYSKDGVPVEGMGKFDSMVGIELSLLYKSPQVRIYQVVNSISDAPGALQDSGTGASMISGQGPGANSVIENVRDIFFILFSGLGILAILVILVITYRLYSKGKELMESIQGTLENVRELTKTAVEDIAKPLAGSASLWSITGGVLGLVTGFGKRRKSRDGKRRDKDKDRDEGKGKDRNRR